MGILPTPSESAAMRTALQEKIKRAIVEQAVVCRGIRGKVFRRYRQEISDCASALRLLR